MKEIDPDEVFHRILNAGEAWTEAHAKATLLEECRKSELNIVIQGHLKAGAKSMAEAESKGLADQRTVDYICEMVKARKLANDAKVKFETAKVWWEACRTQAATLRQEHKMTGG